MTPASPLRSLPTTATNLDHRADDPVAVVVRATRGDGPSLTDTLRRLRAALPRAGVIVEVPDDHVAALARAAAREVGGVDVVARGVDRGGSPAVARAVAAGFEVIAEVPSDLAFQPASVVAVVAALAPAGDSSGAGASTRVAIGARLLEPVPPLWWRLLVLGPSRLAARLDRLPVTDPLSPLRAFRLAAPTTPATPEAAPASVRSPASPTWLDGRTADGDTRWLLAAWAQGADLVEVPVAWRPPPAPASTTSVAKAVAGSLRAGAEVVWWAIWRAWRNRRSA